MSAHEIVLAAEVPRLRNAAFALLLALVPFTMVGLVWAGIFLALGLPFLAGLLVAGAGAITLLMDPTPARRRLAFVGSVPVTFTLVVVLLALTFGDGGDVAYLAYLWVVLSAGAAGWATFVLWPMVELSIDPT